MGEKADRKWREYCVLRARDEKVIAMALLGGCKFKPRTDDGMVYLDCYGELAHLRHTAFGDMYTAASRWLRAQGIKVD